MCQIFPSQHDTPSMGSSWALFAMEMDTSTHGTDRKHFDNAHIAMLTSHVSSLIIPTTIFQARLLRDVKNMKTTICKEEPHLDMVLLAAKLNEIGYRIHLRSALGGGAGITAFHNLRNEFLVVAGEREAEGIDFIVEVRFKEHFEIPHPTDRYAALIQAIPEEIVASPAMLSPLVHLLSSELSVAFTELELSLPPWRHAKSLLSKWLPNPAKAKDIDVCTPHDSPRASSPQWYTGRESCSSGSASPSSSSYFRYDMASPLQLPLCPSCTGSELNGTSKLATTTTTTTTITDNNNNNLSSTKYPRCIHINAMGTHVDDTGNASSSPALTTPVTPVETKPRKSLLSADIQAAVSSGGGGANFAALEGKRSSNLSEKSSGNIIIHSLAMNGVAVETMSHSAKIASSPSENNKESNNNNNNGTPRKVGWECIPPIRTVRMQGASTTLIGNSTVNVSVTTPPVA